MKQSMTIPLPQPGESEEAYERRLREWSDPNHIRSKADNRDWTGSPTFHLSRDNEAQYCPACGALIYPVDTLPCRGVPECAGRMTLDRALSYIEGGQDGG